MLLSAVTMTVRSSFSRVAALAVAASLASAVLFIPRSAHAGCTIECTGIHDSSVTITPPLGCLTLVGALDDSTCVCDTSQVIRNDCAGPVQWTRTAVGSAACVDSCGPFTVAPGEQFMVEVQDTNVNREGQKRTDNLSAKVTVIEVDDASKTEHTIEIKTSADIDPNASACSASPGPARSNGGMLALGLGLAFAAAARRRRLAR